MKLKDASKVIEEFGTFTMPTADCPICLGLGYCSPDEFKGVQEWSGHDFSTAHDHLLEHTTAERIKARCVFRRTKKRLVEE